MKKQQLLDELNWIMNTYPNVGSFESGFRTGLATAIAEIDKLDEPEKVVIPQFVAEYVDLAKSDVTLMRVLEIANRRSELPKWKKEYDWISANAETFARAWLYGYEVEKEKLYYVLDKQDKTLLVLMGGEVKLSGGYELHDSNKDMYQLTEKQIKDYDERFLEFAEEVAE